MDAELDAPHLANDHAFVNLYAEHYDYPARRLLRPGPDSKKTGRSDFLLESTQFQIRGGFKPIDHLRLGVLGKYLMENVSHGRDDEFASTDQIYTEQTTPGCNIRATSCKAAASFNTIGAIIPAVRAAAATIWPSSPIFPMCGATLIPSTSCISRSSNTSDFSISGASSHSAGGIIATDPHAGNLVPFYLQPTLGGSDDLRGYRSFRFYDNNSVVLNGEYRWEVFSGLDMALFVDAGSGL